MFIQCRIFLNNMNTADLLFPIAALFEIPSLADLHILNYLSKTLFYLILYFMRCYVVHKDLHSTTIHVESRKLTLFYLIFSMKGTIKYLRLMNINKYVLCSYLLQIHFSCQYAQMANMSSGFGR